MLLFLVIAILKPRDQVSEFKDKLAIKSVIMIGSQHAASYHNFECTIIGNKRSCTCTQ